jgi:Vacuolar (H+)-ATPase G subunit
MILVDRTKRVKEARDEAKKEIDAYRKQKDEEFKKFEAEVCHLILSDYAYDFPQLRFLNY